MKSHEENVGTIWTIKTNRQVTTARWDFSLEKFQCNVKIRFILSLRSFGSKRLQQAQGNCFN
jgi:hypothetical protein